MSAHDVYLVGCDATTRVLGLDLTDEQERVLRWLVEMVNPAAEGQCKPRLVVEPTPTASPDALCNECWERIGDDPGAQRDPILSGPGEPCWVHSGCVKGAAW